MINFDVQHLVGSLVTIAIVLALLYRRVRRNFGRQRLRRGYMLFRMVLLCVVGALLLIPTFFSTQLAIVTIIGAAIGLGLAVWAAKHTRFLRENGVLYYIPHSYTGMVVTALFVGRLAYRFLVLSQGGYGVATTSTEMGPQDFGGMNGLYHNPVTRMVFFILIGYYVYYYWFVLHESKHLKPEDMEGASIDKPGGNI